MAAIAETNEVKSHARSISLPSTSNPLIASIEVEFLRLNSSSEATSSSGICKKLSGLKRLHECVDDFFHLPLTQQAFSNEDNSKCVEQVLNGSVKLLDLCGTTRDVFSQMKECVKELESSLRRKKGSCVILHNIKSYMFQRKRLSKAVSKHTMRIKEKNWNSALHSSKDSNVKAMVQTLKQVEETSLVVFESILSLFSWHSKTKSIFSGFITMFSKILQSQNLTSDGVTATEIQKNIDVGLLELESAKDISVGEVTKAVEGLKKFESNIEEIEAKLDCLHRQLVKARVSLLNILN